MSIPTIPGVPEASGFLNAGPQGITAGFNLAFDLCNARPIMVYVTEQKPGPGGGGGGWPPTEAPPAGMPAPPPPPAAPIDRPPTPGAQKGGHIWRLIDPLAPVEKLPVFKEWSEEKTYPNGHWKPVYYTPPPKKTEPTPDKPSIKVRTKVISRGTDTLFKFDKPKNTSDLLTSFAPGDPGAAVMAEVSAALNEPAVQEPGGSVPIGSTPFERRVVLFGHADMCAPFWYNHSLSHRRNLALGAVMPPDVKGAMLNTGRSAGFAPCSDFNPLSGPNHSDPNDDELRAENSADGFAPTIGAPGNQENRRVELFVIPDYKASSGKPSKIKEILSNLRTSLMASSGVSAADWPDGQFPCPAGKTPTSAGDDSRFAVCRALNSQPPPGHKAPAPGQGPLYRHCKFYKQFTEAVRNLEIVDEVTQPGEPGQPGGEEPQEPVFEKWEWVEDPPVTEKTGEYHPPPGEHYSYYMDNMVKEGVAARDIFQPAVAVAPNDRVNSDDFNLIRAGTVRVVKMDIGFWGDERTKDVSRQAGLRRTPKRYFGLIEGQFVFNCFFETPDSAGFVRPCSEGFDQDLTPLCFQLDQACRAAGFKINIQAKAVAEDGPDKQRLKVMFPDMHLPRRFDDLDPVYATDECIARAQSVKSMVLHQLKRDYRLTADMTPWLTTLDRRMCRDFFENNAPRLKLPHIYLLGGPKLGSRTSGDDGIVAQATDAVRSAFNFLMQVGFRMFEFTQADYRRMVRKYPDNFPEKGYGRTKDLLFNWFYGSTTDRNIPGAPESVLERTGKNLVPELVQEVLDLHAGTSLELDEGTAPANESLATVEAGPARDLLRFLRVIDQLRRQQRAAIDVIQTGDLYELWANRRFLHEDMHETDDPVGQLPELMSGLTSPTSSSGPLGAFGAAAGDAMKFLLGSLAKIVLGGVNATDHDLWWRRETDKAAANPQLDMDVAQLPPERAINITKLDPELHLPRFTGPTGGGIGGGMTTPPGGGQISADGVEWDEFRLGTPGPNNSLGPFPATNDRGKGYLRTETQRRIRQVESFVAPLRTDAAGNQEDRQLLGNRITGRNRDQGLWNAAVVDAFRRVGATFVYGNHDGYRGVPRSGGLGAALPYYSEPGLWIEHGHRYEDSNVDGQPFGSFLTNLAYEIQELAFGEGLLDEYSLHREQSIFQPGILQWFLLVQFGGPDFLKRFQRPNENVPAVHPFRICVNSHTHVPDLVIAEFIFKDREVAEVELPLVGSVGVETLVNMGGAALKAVLLWKKFEEWYEAWEERGGFKKWWEDIKGNTINWGVDFAGLSQCVDRAIDFIREKGENTGRKLVNEFRQSGQSFKDMIDQNRRNLGL